MPQIYRVAVRGRFDSLSDESRAGLAAAVEDHDVVTSGGFSDDGKLSYDRHLDFFTYRVQLRTDAEDGADGVTREATRRALDAIGVFGADVRDVKVTLTDMAGMWR